MFLSWLSTVCQNAEQLAKRSIDILLENISGALTPTYETIAVSVELRESIRNI